LQALHRDGHRLAAERQPPGQHLEHDDPERIEVGGLVDVPTFHLLGAMYAGVPVIPWPTASVAWVPRGSPPISRAMPKSVTTARTRRSSGTA